MKHSRTLDLLTRVTRYASTALVLLACACALFTKPAKPLRSEVNYPPPQAKAIASTVVLVNKDAIPVCAGEFVGPREILTARHCTVAATDCPRDALADKSCQVGVTVRFVNRQGFLKVAQSSEEREPDYLKAKVVATDVEYDLALLRAADASDVWVGIRKSPPAQSGESGFVVGHPQGAWYSVRPAYVDYLHDGFLWVSTEVAGGSSGGALYDEQGALIGVTLTRDGTGTKGGFAGAEAVIRLIQSSF